MPAARRQPAREDQQPGEGDDPPQHQPDDAEQRRGRLADAVAGDQERDPHDERQRAGDGVHADRPAGDLDATGARAVAAQSQAGEHHDDGRERGEHVDDDRGHARQCLTRAVASAWRSGRPPGSAGGRRSTRPVERSHRRRRSGGCQARSASISAASRVSSASTSDIR